MSRARVRPSVGFYKSYNFALALALLAGAGCRHAGGPGGPTDLPAFCAGPAPAARWQSVHVGRGGDGRLIYPRDAQGNRIVDFSYAGYRHGEVAPPRMPAVAHLGPAEGDNTSRIQAALDAIGARGDRGALVLAPGRYEIAGTLRVNRSGVVLRGAGDGEDPRRATILVATGDVPHQRTVVVLGSGKDGWSEVGPRHTITTWLVPVGAQTFAVDDTSTFVPGDAIVVHHPSTAAWISAVEGGGTGQDPPWSPGSMDIRYHRRVAAVAGNTLTLDAPVFNHLDRALAPAYVVKVAAQHASEVGVEDLRVDIATRGGEDEDHAWTAIGLVGAHDAWVRGVTALHFGYAGVRVSWSVRVTIADTRALDPVAIRTGGRMYNISVDHGGQLVLVQGCATRGGRHALVSNGGSTASGIVYHRCRMAHGDHVEAGHRRWVQAVLYDNVVETASDATYILLGNRGDWGTAHGWAAVHSVIWGFNRQMIVQKPPTAQNYAVSTAGTRRAPRFPGPDGSIEIGGPGLWPASLYEAQLCERLRARAARP